MSLFLFNFIGFWGFSLSTNVVIVLLLVLPFLSLSNFTYSRVNKSYKNFSTLPNLLFFYKV